MSGDAPACWGGSPQVLETSADVTQLSQTPERDINAAVFHAAPTLL